MQYAVFYSWQTDVRGNANRTLIREALDGAVAVALRTGTVADVPRVDSGMEGVAGSPEVATVMFEKIEKSAIFVGDLTLAGQVGADDSAKRTPNPNVLLELGFAAATLGWGRVITVMNEFYGSAFDQPFDVRNRRFPVRYSLDPGTPDARAAALSALTRDLAGALSAVMDTDLERAAKTARSLDTSCRTFIALYAGAQLIPEPHPNTFTLGAANGLDTPRLLAAISRLLELDVIEWVKTDTGQSAYAWTWLGREVVAAVNA